ncbi:MAG: beta-ketoacyl-[acyl-carrier-protein] synthase family protein [Syntrophales bacterium]
MNNDRLFPQGERIKRVVVTGIGMVTPLGIGKEDFSKRLFSGDSAISDITSFDTSAFPSHLGAEVTNFSARDFISIKTLRRMDRISQMTTAAVRLALDDAGLNVSIDNRDRIGIIFGTAFGATDVTSHFAETLIRSGPAFVNPIMVPNTVMNAAAGHASIELGFRGVNVTVTEYAVSAETAIAYAVNEIRRGTADCILAGGSDILSKFYYEALTRFLALSPINGGVEACKPFDMNRNGTVAGEGCGFVCIEYMEKALARGGRRPYCEITGMGMGSSPTPPLHWPSHTAGIKRTIQRAMADAGITANDVQAVSAAANGSMILDATEAGAYSEIFVDAKTPPLITSLKGAIGESYSSGGMRACALALSMGQNVLPPTVGLLEPLGPLAFVSGEARESKMEHAMLAGVSFGGTYVYLIFTKYNQGESR